MKYVQGQDTTCVDCGAPLVVFETDGQSLHLYKYGCCGFQRKHRWVAISRSQILT